MSCTSSLAVYEKKILIVITSKKQYYTLFYSLCVYISFYLCRFLLTHCFTEVQCGESPDILHSSKVVKGNSYGDTVTYECDFGYTISSGNETIECQIHGYWSAPPTCKGIQFSVNLDPPHNCHHSHQIKAGQLWSSAVRCMI